MSSAKPSKRRKKAEDITAIQRQAVRLGVYFERERCARVADTVGRATNDPASLATALFIVSLIRGSRK